MHNAIPTQSHSGLGITALTISLGAGALLVLLMGIAGVLDSQPGGMDENSVAANAIGLGVLFSALAQTLALALGIAGLVQAGRNKLYAVLGTVFAATGLGGTGLVLLLGAFMKG